MCVCVCVIYLHKGCFGFGGNLMCYFVDRCRLQVFHLHNNHLTMLPEQLVALHRLSSLAVPFNRYITLPLVAAQMTHVQVLVIPELFVMYYLFIQNVFWLQTVQTNV